MILWTPQPLELVFENNQNEVITGVSPLEIDYKGRKVLVEAVDVNKQKIVQLISTDPQDYLLEDFQPGTIINSL